MASRKHRYLVCKVAVAIDEAPTASALLKLVKEQVVAEGGEIGLGRMNPLIRFFDRESALALFRLSRDSTSLFQKATKFPVLRISGSMRTCRPHAIKLLRRHFREANLDQDRLEEPLRALKRAAY